MSKIEEFKKYAKNMIEDGYLDVGEEREAMIKAAELGLESKVAMKTLEELCISNGATLERVAQEQFRNRILDFIDDGFLDNGEEEDLLTIGLEMLDNNLEMVKGLITATLQAKRALSEKELTEMLRKRLQPTINAGGILSAESWKTHRDAIYRIVEDKEVDTEENDIDATLIEIRDSLGIVIGNPNKGGGGSSNNTIVIVALLVVAVMGFMFVGGGTDTNTTNNGLSGNGQNTIGNNSGVGDNGVSDGGGTGEGPSTKKYPSCDSFAPELKQANKSWHEAAEKSNYCTGNPTVYTLNKKIKDYCEPFMDLSRKSQRKAETQYPCWEYCERDQEQIDLIADKYIAWAKKRSGGIKSCEWIRRCLAVVENHAACTEAKKTYGCDISQAALTRCQ